MKIKPEDLIGYEYKDSMVVRYLGKIRNNYSHYYLIKCNVCRETHISVRGSIKRNSFGCPSCARRHEKKKYAELLLKYNLTDKDINSLYSRWYSMKRRCLKTKDPHYRNYGGVGITICDEWINDKTQYALDVCAKGWKKGLDIDRINNSGNYCNENIRCVSHIINSLSRKTTKGNPFITKTASNTYQIQMTKIKLNKNFKTLQEAINKRNELIIENKLVDYYSLLPENSK